jgi:membrane protein
VLALFLGAAGVFLEMQDSLDRIWRVKPKPGRGILGMIKDRATSFAMVLGIGFLLLVSLVISAGLAAFGNYLDRVFDIPEIFFHAVNFIISFFAVAGVFILIYKILPDVWIAWQDTFLGALIASLLFDIGKLGIGLYLGHSTIASSYGAAGSLVVLMVWVFYSTQILFFGAEFTKVYADVCGKKIIPSSKAIPIDKIARKWQLDKASVRSEASTSGRKIPIKADETETEYRRRTAKVESLRKAKTEITERERHEDNT